MVRLFALIRRLAAGNKSVIYISHFLEEVREVADDCTVLRDGQDVFHGPLHQLGDDRLISLMVGRTVNAFSLLAPSYRHLLSRC